MRLTFYEVERDASARGSMDVDYICHRMFEIVRLCESVFVGQGHTVCQLRIVFCKDRRAVIEVKVIAAFGVIDFKFEAAIAVVTVKFEIIAVALCYL